MIKVENLKKNFGALQVLDGISFELEKGKVLAVVGPSGTGKSTLLRCLNYLEKPSEGKITIGNISADSKKIQKQEIYRLRAKTAMVFQNYNLFKNKTALQNIMEPMISVQGMEKKRQKKKQWKYCR